MRIVVTLERVAGTAKHRLDKAILASTVRETKAERAVTITAEDSFDSGIEHSGDSGGHSKTRPVREMC